MKKTRCQLKLSKILEVFFIIVNFIVGTGKIKRMDQNLQSRKKFTPMKMRAMSINTDRSLDLSEITEISVSANEGSVKETMIKLTQQQVMNNYLAT